MLDPSDRYPINVHNDNGLNNSVVGDLNPGNEPQRSLGVKTRPGRPFSGSATLGRSFRWMYDSPVTSKSPLSRSVERLPSVGGSNKHLEYIKTAPTPGKLNYISSSNSGSSLNVCQQFENTLLPPSPFQNRVDLPENFSVIGPAGHSGSRVQVKKGGSLPRLKFSEDQDSGFVESWSTMLSRPPANIPLNSVFPGLKKPRV